MSRVCFSPAPSRIYDWKRSSFPVFPLRFFTPLSMSEPTPCFLTILSTSEPTRRPPQNPVTCSEAEAFPRCLPPQRLPQRSSAVRKLSAHTLPASCRNSLSSLRLANEADRGRGSTPSAKFLEGLKRWKGPSSRPHRTWQDFKARGIPSFLAVFLRRTTSPLADPANLSANTSARSRRTRGCRAFFPVSSLPFSPSNNQTRPILEEIIPSRGAHPLELTASAFSPLLLFTLFVCRQNPIVLMEDSGPSSGAHPLRRRAPECADMEVFCFLLTLCPRPTITPLVEGRNTVRIRVSGRVVAPLFADSADLQRDTSILSGAHFRTSGAANVQS